MFGRRGALIAKGPPMRAFSLLLLLAAAGCYRSPGPPAEDRAPAPAGPAPRLEVEATTFKLSRAPAVSADGAAVLIGIQDSDGPRGYANYRLELRDRRDAKIAGQTVLTVDEAESMFGPEGATAKLAPRIAAANRWLEEQHAAKRFAPLRELEVER